MIALARRAVARSLHLNLRERVVLLSFLGVAVSFISFWTVGTRAVLESTNQTLQERQAAAQSAAQYIDRLLGHSLNTIANIAQTIAALPPGDDRRTEDLLRGALPEPEAFTYLAVLDAEGRLTVAQPPQPALRGLVVAEKDLAPARERGIPVVTGLLQLPGSDRPAVWLAVPVGSGQAGRRLLVAALDLAGPGAAYYTGLPRQAGGGLVQILDSRGMVLNHIVPELRFRASENQELYRSLVEAGITTVTTRDTRQAKGTERSVIAIAPLHVAPWAVIVEQAENEVLAAESNMAWQLAGLAAGFGVIIIALMWFTTARVLGPVFVLTQAAGKMAGGDLSAAVPITGSDELRDLALAFDDMRRKLAESYAHVQQLYRQAKSRHGREQTMLLRFSQDALAGADVEWTLARAAGVAATLTAADAASISLLDAPDRAPTVRAVHGGDRRSQAVPATEREAVFLAAQQRQAILVGDFLTDDRFSVLPIFGEHGVRSGLAVPMLVGDKLAGVAYTSGNQPNAFDQQDADVMALLANQTALALEKSRFLAESTRRARELSILYDFSQSIGQALNLGLLCDRLVTTLEERLGYEYPSVTLLDENGRIQAADGQSPERPSGGLGGIRGRIVDTGQAVRVDDVLGDPDYVAMRPDVRSMMGVPIREADRVAGVIIVESSQIGAFTDDDVRLLQAVAGPVGIAAERARLFEDVQRRADEFASLYEMSAVVGSSLHADHVLHSVVSSALTLMDADACSIALVDQARGELRVQASLGAFTQTPGEASQRVGDGIAGWVAQTGEPLLVQGDSLPPQLRNLSVRDCVTSAVAVPLKAANRTLGVITVASLDHRRFSESDVQLLSRLAADAGLALENANLYDELQRSFLETVAALAEAVDAKDPYTRGHSERVTDLAVAVGRELGVSGEALTSLRSAAVLHDIGKIGIAERILRKPGPLDDKEWETMRTHPDLGASIVGPVSALREVVPLLQHHHERWDGSGYPSRLKGEEIPLGSRILALADSYEAMTSDRAYRAAMAPEQALEILKDGAGRQWDPGVVAAFIKLREAGQA